MFEEGMKKRCSFCRTRKLISEFSEDHRGSLGVHGWCKRCRNRKGQAAYVKHLEVRRKKAADYHRKNPGSYLKRLYGITEGDYAALLFSQGGSCAICKVLAVGRLSVDHDHKSGKVRGLLCRRCNTALGNFKDSPAIILEAIKYLEKNKQ